MRLVNFRDLGGLPLMTGGTLPSGRFYRSGTLEHLSQTEAGELASNLALATVIDLRAPAERKWSHLFPDKVEVLEIPFLTEIDPGWERPKDQSPRAVASRYLEMLELQGREALHAIITAITPDAVPMVIHCAAGRDRTGIVMALLLSITGITDEAIASDYAKSGPVLQHLASDSATAGILEPDLSNEYETSPETMRRFLGGVRELYGSSEELAISSNLRADDIQTARATLLAPK
jgi:rhodanese-related sulfurtransferase